MVKTLEDINQLEIEVLNDNSSEKYLYIISCLEERYKKYPNEVEPVIRLLYILWIWMLEHGSGWMPDLSNELYEIIENKAKFLYIETKNKFSDNADYQWVVGYMVDFAGYYFGEDNNFEEIGLNMMKKAFQLSPENKLYKLSIMSKELGIEEKLNNLEYLELCKNSTQITKVHFDNRGCMGDYFQMIYSQEGEPERLREYYEDDLKKKQKKYKISKKSEKKFKKYLDDNKNEISNALIIKYLPTKKGRINITNLNDFIK